MVNAQESLLVILIKLIITDKYRRTSPLFFFVLFQIVVFVSAGTLRLGVKMSSRLRYANGCPECFFYVKAKFLSFSENFRMLFILLL